ncbi:MAG: Fic family protein [Bacteroidales bacterium]|nr:Fic family protein [Bacteroidales bacterium]MCM1147884.1 Fic family protein [Bacteroidales bacterium]MCM1206727.1 Fic family protein [Bacillota bacterium]MCM1510923.1 Fic family protein [Clostridium sp.]
MIEPPPSKPKKNIKEAISLLNTPNLNDLFNKIDNEYLYWDKIKYYAPQGVTPEALWHAVKLRRSFNSVNISFGNLNFHFTITGRMQQLLHEFDLNFGGNLGSDSIIPEKSQQHYLINSIMEEAIASSKMEGASTTRKIAKEMLRKQSKPTNKSQQMIVNNYNTIRYLVEHQKDDLNIERLLEVHRCISTKTLDNPVMEGALRTDNTICVINDITGEIVHTPPPAGDLNNLLSELCDFANADDDTPFIHPIIKGIIIHFMLAYFHPFVDGNGRASRSLVYWYLLKKGYLLTEYLSISRVIYKNKAQYEKAFLYTENDTMDLSYFINFNLNTMKKAYEDLKMYLQKKIKEQQEFYRFRGFSNINERQAEILRIYSDKPQTLLTAKELATRFPITVKTARADLQHLVELGLVVESPINRRMIGYIRSNDFESKFAELTNK